MARLELEIGYNKSINRETRMVGVDDDLYALSKGMEQYRGYHINEVNPIRRIVTFTNGVEIHTGDVLGDVSEQDVRRIQIRETIRSHFEKERELFNRRIKTLSLFLSIRWSIIESMMRKGMKSIQNLARCLKKNIRLSQMNT